MFLKNEMHSPSFLICSFQLPWIQTKKSSVCLPICLYLKTKSSIHLLKMMSSYWSELPAKRAAVKGLKGRLSNFWKKVTSNVSNGSKGEGPKGKGRKERVGNGRKERVRKGQNNHRIGIWRKDHLEGGEMMLTTKMPTLVIFLWWRVIQIRRMQNHTPLKQNQKYSIKSSISTWIM